MPAEGKPRCPWARTDLDIRCHDGEWGAYRRAFAGFDPARVARWPATWPRTCAGSWPTWASSRMVETFDRSIVRLREERRLL